MTERTRQQTLAFARRFGLNEADVDRVLQKRAGYGRMKPQRVVRLAQREQRPAPPSGLRVSIGAEMRAKGRGWLEELLGWEAGR